MTDQARFAAVVERVKYLMSEENYSLGEVPYEVHEFCADYGDDITAMHEALKETRSLNVNLANVTAIKTRELFEAERQLAAKDAEIERLKAENEKLRANRCSCGPDR